MDDRLFAGSIMRVTNLEHEDNYLQFVRTAILYKDSEEIYTDLDENISYKILKNGEIKVGDLVVNPSSLINVSFEELKPKYRYLVSKHLENPVVNTASKHRGKKLKNFLDMRHLFNR